MATRCWRLLTSRCGGLRSQKWVHRRLLPTQRRRRTGKAANARGADYLGWSSDGSGVWWAIGNTFHSRPLDSLSFEADDADSEKPLRMPMTTHQIALFLKMSTPPSLPLIWMWSSRSTPTGALLLERVNLISMSGESTDAMAEVRTSQDILIVDNRIHAIGNHGSLAVPEGAARRDLTTNLSCPVLSIRTPTGSSEPAMCLNPTTGRSSPMWLMG